MPTGYTAAIADGIRFRTFAMNCARAFGALIDIRDEATDAPIPDELKPSDYHLNAVELAQRRLAALNGMSQEEANRQARLRHDTDIADRQKQEEGRAALLGKYLHMLAQAENWAPPTPAHQGVKTFMIEQLRQSMAADCHTFDGPPPLLLSGADWLAEQRTQANSDIDYHQKRYAEDVKRAADSTAWVKALRASLPQT